MRSTRTGTTQQTDTASAVRIAAGLEAHAGKLAGVHFAIALLDASIIGAFAVSLSTAYAIGDVFGIKHSLHRGVGRAKGFYAVHAGLVAAAAAIVLIPGSPLGLLTEGVQTLAGVLLPSASAFLLLLLQRPRGPRPLDQRTQDQRLHCRRRRRPGHPVDHPDRLGPLPGHQRGRDPRHHGRLRGGRGDRDRLRGGTAPQQGLGPRRPTDRTSRDDWRMPPLETLPKPIFSTGHKIGMGAVRGYLLVAMILGVVKIVEVALGH
ncbi:divalent metal cation transporter [Streptomyces lydicus]|uniref:divalent metal cation transporter n=1 Tax=Streptomyces lydicus TaxID=47763 RepID=UPI0037B03D61